MQILQSRLSGDLDNLTRRIEKVSGPTPPDGHLTADRLRQAISEMLSRFPVYRTYIGAQGFTETDRMYVRQAVSRSIGSRPGLRVEIEFVRDLLLGRDGFAQPAGKSTHHRERLRAVRAFQQLSSALMAKGFEDTAFYRYHRLVSLNEVGGEPSHFGCSANDFHAFVAARAARWPHTMNSTATHDSKRGEDVRARLNALSEIPVEWEAQLKNWHALNRDCRIETDRGAVPDRNAEYLLYQTLIGSWPGAGAVTERYVDRIKAYMIKAVREAGEFTSWIDPRQDYESGLAQFTEGILDAAPQNRFMQEFAAFCQKIAFYGMFNSLSQVVLKAAAPGIPDFYQGTELPQLALVDPDNRRPVSYARRRSLLETLAAITSNAKARVGELLQNKDDGRIKLFVVARALAARRRREDLFHRGRYVPLETRGAHRGKIFAFARVLERQWCIAVVPRFLTGLVAPPRDPLGLSVWSDTEVVLPAGAPRCWRNQFTGQQLQARELIAVAVALEDFPVALLMGGQTP
jgi:(1->4)-alpha-D-glucan 1-alpha-D-glucosylmutase